MKGHVTVWCLDVLIIYGHDTCLPIDSSSKSLDDYNGQGLTQEIGCMLAREH